MTSVQTQLEPRLRSAWVEARRDWEMRNRGVASKWGKRRVVQYDGGISKEGKHYKPAWPKLAEFCWTNNLIPEVLVDAVFHFSSSQYPPTPNQAKGEKAIQLYQKYLSPGTQSDIRT